MKTNLINLTGLILLCAVFTSFSGVDINDEQAVFNDIQGTWTGCEYSGTFYRHIKISISDNSYDGWLQVSDTRDEPEWTVLPGEKGTISLSSVLESADAGKYRRFKFQIQGCCGDNSYTAKTLSDLINYMEGAGLYVAGKTAMTKK